MLDRRLGTGRYRVPDLQPAPHRGGQCARYHPPVRRAGKRTRRQAHRAPRGTTTTFARTPCQSMNCSVRHSRSEATPKSPRALVSWFSCRSDRALTAKSRLAHPTRSLGSGECERIPSPAAHIGRPKSTISREPCCNRLPSGRYSPLHAAGAYQLRRRRNTTISLAGTQIIDDTMKPGGIAWSQRLVYGDRRHVTWLNAFVTPILSGSAVASTAFCACSTSCLVCSVSACI